MVSFDKFLQNQCGMFIISIIFIISPLKEENREEGKEKRKKIERQTETGTEREMKRERERDKERERERIKSRKTETRQGQKNKEMAADNSMFALGCGELMEWFKFVSRWHSSLVP